MRVVNHRASSPPASTGRTRAMFEMSCYLICESCVEATLSIRLPNIGAQPRGPQGLVGWSDLLVAGGSCNVLRFNMPGEIVQDSLPTSALVLPIDLRLRLKRLPHKDSVGAFGELNLDVPTVSQPVFDYLLGHDSSVRPLKVEPGTAVFCLHSR